MTESISGTWENGAEVMPTVRTVQLSELDLLKVKCAALEFQITQKNLEEQFSEAAKTRDGIIDPIVNMYRSNPSQKVSVDMSTGVLTFVEE